jgi:hypothetical protein
MKFETIRYEGKSPYTDRTPMRNAWEPGEEKLVSEADAKQLMRYLEFKRATPEPKNAAEVSDKGATGGGKDADTALALATQAKAEQQKREKLANEQIESTLLEVSQMTKGALADFARQNYAVELDTKSKVGDLRNQVTSLVQGGRP